MKLTKYHHSCILIEEQETTILIDPGIFTYQEKILDLAKIQSLKYLLITHSHQDHMAIPLIKEILTKFPTLRIISNEHVRDLLKIEGITVETNPVEHIAMSESNHGPLFDQTPPPNTQFDVFDTLTHPGDSLVFREIKEVLALPLEAPWGSTVWAVDTAMKFKPKTIIPIHDYLLKDDVRKATHQRLKEFFSKFSITFKPLESGETIEI